MSHLHGGFGPPVPLRPHHGGHPRWTAALLIALSLAVLASAGGLVWAVGQRLGAKRTATAPVEPAAPARLPAEPIEATAAWHIPAPDLSIFDERVQQGGVWLYEDTVVRVMPEALVSYALADGSERWSMPLAAGSNGCTSSSQIDAGRIAVLSGMNCEYLVVVDLATGEDRATISLTSTRLKVPYQEPALLGDTVAVGSPLGGAGFRISDGEQLWWHEPGGRCVETGYTVLDDILVSEVACGTGCNDLGICGYGYAATGLRATTENGEELWRWEFGHEVEGSQLEIIGVISVDPLVIHARLDGTFGGVHRIFVVEDTRNSVLREVGYQKDRHLPPCTVLATWWCADAVVGGDYLAVSGMDTVGLSVFDLATGELVGDVPPEGRSMRPIAMVEDEFLVYRGEWEDRPGMVVAIDPQTMTQRTVMTLDEDAALEHDMWGIAGYGVRLVWDTPTRTLVMAATEISESARLPETSLLAYR
ncbi:hypothetical protein [Streptomyces xiamenensis]|uniref:hypothetical protein n=1 Tax=Streptomyces xiamenensis TaxID=408015 RepID=UPI0037D2E570